MYESEPCCLRETVALLRKIKIALMTAMCGVKWMDRKSTHKNINLVLLYRLKE